MDLRCIYICFIQNKHCNILESIDSFDHLSEVHVVHGQQSKMVTCLTKGNTSGHNGIEGMNKVPLVFEGKRLPAQWLIAFNGDNSGYNVYRSSE